MSKNFELMQQLESSGPVDPVASVPQEFAHLRSDHRWASAEALTLVQRIFLLQTETPPKVVVFAGIDHNSGCSGISVAVAEALSANSRGSVCIVEANFRTPSLASSFGVSNRFGLTDALLHQEPVQSFCKPVKGNNSLWLIPSGPIAEDSPSLLSSEYIQKLLAELRASYDFVIVDAPPLTRYADAIAVGRLADGMVLVLEANATRREAAQAVVANLRSSKIEVLAAVLNKRTFPIPESLYKRL